MSGKPPGGTVLAANAVLAPDGVLEPGWVLLDGDRVTATGHGEPPADVTVTPLPGTILTPGFVDVHCHRSHGTTTLVASLVTAELDDLERAVSALADLVDGGLLAGTHLEGPWLSPAHRGAHDPTLLRPPAAGDVERLLAAGRGTVRMVTLAPELDGGIEAVRRIVGHGAVAAVGHTDATYDVTREAIEAGATVGTHLHNAMRSMHHREPGPAAALLEDPRCRVELVADGLHLHDAVLRQAVRLAGPGRYLLVTDAMDAAAAGDGDYELGGLAVAVRDGQARLASNGSLAGSTLTQHAAVRHLCALGVPLTDIVRAATATPARALGLDIGLVDGVGALGPGSPADLVALDGDLDVVAVMHAGRWVLGRGPGGADGMRPG